MNNVTIDFDWMDDNSSINGTGLSIKVNSRIFIIGTGVIEDE